MTTTTPEALLAEALKAECAAAMDDRRCPDGDGHTPDARALLATHPPLAQALARGLAPDGLALREAEHILVPRYGMGGSDPDSTYLRRCIDTQCMATSAVVSEGWPPVEHRPGCAVAEALVALRDHPPTVAPDTLDAAAPRMREALDDWQRYAGTFSDTLLALGHHNAAQHQSPDQYDSESGLACIAPGCLAALTVAASLRQQASGS